MKKKWRKLVIWSNSFMNSPVIITPILRPHGINIKTERTFANSSWILSRFWKNAYK